MKNLHVLPTDKSSRLVKIKDNLCYTTTENIPGGVYQHIYITSDEEIKKGDWYWLEKINRIGSESGVYKSSNVKVSKLNTLALNCQKIILTTDQDLIKDGVQAIDDEFLEWFVKNPSCEEVEVKTYSKKIGVETDANGYREMDVLGKDYRLIIPKEEPNKTSYLDELPNMDKDVLLKMWESAIPKLKLKQETLEEVAERLHPEEWDWREREIFKEGAKWQAERMYSEEEVLELLLNRPGPYLSDEEIKEWFEQFSKLKNG